MYCKTPFQKRLLIIVVKMTARPVRHLSLPPVEQQSTYHSRFMTIYREELDTFFSLLVTSPIKQLLEKDRCYSHVDNYLLAMVFVYFKRAGLTLPEYTVDNFWLCLYLAHDQEEDEDELKWELLPWALGDKWMSQFRKFSLEKDDIWKRMAYRSVVSRVQCDQIMAISSFPLAWGRVRGEAHGGAVRRGDFVQTVRGLTPTCVRCKGWSRDRKDVFLVNDQMEVEVEFETENVDNDSGMETDGDVEIFPEE